MAKASKPAPKKPAAKPAPQRASSASTKIAKTQIIDTVADKTSLNKKQAGDAVATMLDAIVGALKSGQSVGLPGLGTLSVAQTAARTGVRPGTSQKITIPAGKKVRFKVASTLKGTL
ncbi:DNA-binding protein HU-beta [Deinococcus metalli]|uniref:DNA-binding protein HU n=1 Tax=Deinococcus metalli TaxID=1141878 RepID=A0A7W8KAA8_9DEIO|nr:HU family DNA-binding protein [Deinococcus metalli]MBB5374562.1 DNA-binding protein HU-beta [Deinococcus metalli]GHF35351.1 DNA-binding protein HU [Deinococcus metalli]